MNWTHIFKVFNPIWRSPFFLEALNVMEIPRANLTLKGCSSPVPQAMLLRLVRLYDLCFEFIFIRCCALRVHSEKNKSSKKSPHLHNLPLSLKYFIWDITLATALNTNSEKLLRIFAFMHVDLNKIPQLKQRVKVNPRYKICCFL